MLPSRIMNRLMIANTAANGERPIVLPERVAGHGSSRRADEVAAERSG